MHIEARSDTMIGRRMFIGLLAGALQTVPLAVEAQRSATVPRIGFLGMDSQMQGERVAAFQDGLRVLGYIEGRNIIIEYRWAEGRFDRLPELAAELVGLKVGVIVTAAPPSVRAAQRSTTTIPIVMSVHDPVGMGFVGAIAHPGGNITGLAFQDSELSTKRLDLLRQAVPNLVRVAILWNEAGGGIGSVHAVENAARALGLQVRDFEVREPSDFATAIAAAKSWGAQGVIQLASPFITKHRKILLELLRANRLPATCEMREYVVEGCLMTYSASLNAIFRGMASFVDRILKGAKPADLAIEQPREFEFVINQTTAQSLGLTMPSLLLVQATEVIR
jgi:putative tryptophan/tyrosine transport system substrate-binding protein